MIMSGLKNIFFGGDSSSSVDQSKVKLQEKTKDTANKLSNVLADNVVYDNFTASTPNSVVLNGIYKLMMKNNPIYLIFYKKTKKIKINKNN